MPLEQRGCFAQTRDLICNTAHAEVEVGPVEGVEGHQGPAHPEEANDVGASHGRGGRGERDGRRTSQSDPMLAQSPVMRPKVVTPLADTVCLIDGKEWSWRIRFAVDQLRHSLWRHIQQLQPPLGVGVPHLALLVRLLRTAQILRRNTAPLQCGHLILHE